MRAINSTCLQLVPEDMTVPADNASLVDLFSREESNRMTNFLQIISSTLEVEVRRSPGEVAALALRRANDQVHALGVLHRLLAQPQRQQLLPLRHYLDELSFALETLIFMARDFSLVKTFDVKIDNLLVDASRMRLLALGITELLVNVSQSALDKNSRRVKLAVRTSSAELVC